jgi:hypothetical protein
MTRYELLPRQAAEAANWHDICPNVGGLLGLYPQPRSLTPHAAKFSAAADASLGHLKWMGAARSPEEEHSFVMCRLALAFCPRPSQLIEP